MAQPDKPEITSRSGITLRSRLNNRGFIAINFPAGIEDRPLFRDDLHVLIDLEEQGNPQYPRDYRPAERIEFMTSLEALKELVGTLERLI